MNAGHLGRITRLELDPTGRWSADYECTCGAGHYEIRKDRAEVEARLLTYAEKHHAKKGGTLLPPGSELPSEALERRRNEFAARCRSSDVVALAAEVVLVGGFGFEPLVGGELCGLAFTADEVEVFDGHFIKVATVPYTDLVVLGVDGPGAVKTGGGFIGGGFGLTGAVEGMAIASVLNALTARTKIRTYIELQDHASHWVFASSTQTPQELRLPLRSVHAKMRVRDAAPSHANAVIGTDMISMLERLASLHSSGALSDDEFVAAKAKLLS